MTTRRMPANTKEHDRLAAEIDRVLHAPEASVRRGAGGERRGPDALVARAAGYCGASRAQAETAVRVVLAALSDRLPPAEARHLAAQLPEPWKASVTKRPAEGVQKMDREQFVGRLARDLGADVAGAIRTARGVMAALGDSVSEGELRQAVGSLPPDLREVVTD